MPGSTPNYGIVFPCETEPITLAALNTYTSGVEAAVSTVDTIATAAIDPPTVYVRASTPFTATVNVVTTATFDTERYDRGGFWTAAAPTLFTLPLNGTYLATASVERSSSAGTFTSMRGAILVAGVERGYQRIETASTSGPMTIVALLPSATAGQNVTFTVLYTGSVTSTFQAKMSINYVSTT